MTKRELQLAEALVFLHNDARQLHRNICPEAVCINERGAWKLSAFDFAAQAIDRGYLLTSLARKNKGLSCRKHCNTYVPVYRMGSVSAGNAATIARLYGTRSDHDRG